MYPYLECWMRFGVLAFLSPMVFPQNLSEPSIFPLITSNETTAIWTNIPNLDTITTSSSPILPCGNSVCRVDLDEVCALRSFQCECPERKDRRNESERCTGYTDVTFPLLLARDQPTGPLFYNQSYANRNSPIYSNFVGQVESGLTNILQRSTHFPAFIRLRIERLIRPSDVNASLGDGGLWLEYTLRLANVTRSSDAEIHQDLQRIIAGQFAGSLGGMSLMADQRQIALQCFRASCARDGGCGLVDGEARCTCPIGCADVDSSRPGRICSCPCSSPETNSCPAYSDCIPSIDNRAGYACRCKTGFLDISSGSRDANGSRVGDVENAPRCVLDRCLGREAECARTNGTCAVLDETRFECRCLDGHVSVETPKGNRCLKPQDVDECSLQVHKCLAPATCGKLRSVNGYQCTCPDGSSADPEVQCPLGSRLQCAQCNQRGTCEASLDNKTVVCRCDDGYSGEDCSIVLPTIRKAQVLAIGGFEMDWSWIAFGIGLGLGILLCVILLTAYKIARRQCRKKPTIRPSVDDEVFNFHEVTRNVYGVGNTSVGSPNKSVDSKLSGPIRTSFNDVTLQYNTSTNGMDATPYAVSEVNVSTFKRNGAQS